jgi:hypothetical protein
MVDRGWLFGEAADAIRQQRTTINDQSLAAMRLLCIFVFIDLISF